MARIEFHFNAPALVPYACRLLRKVQARGLRAQVIGSDSLLSQLDQALWTFSPLDFLSHCAADAPSPMRDASVVLLSAQPLQDWHREVVINLGEQVLENFDTFQRVIDVVSVDELHRAQGRERWRQYGRLGHELVRHDLSPTRDA
ncbi:MAG: DNA polymerase III subunit chi [Limnohabitans sp.]